MAATILGLDSTSVRPQPAFRCQQSENGGWTASHTIIVTRAGFDTAGIQALFAKGSLLTGVDAGIPTFFAFLKITDVSVSAEEGELITLEVSAAGSSASQYELGDGTGLDIDSLPTYELRGQLSDASFSHHRKWLSLSDEDKTYLGALLDGKYYYDITTGLLMGIYEDAFLADYVSINQLTAADAKSFAALIQQGQTTYERSQYTWTETTEGLGQLTAAQLNKLGLIATPRGTPPEAGGTRNWKLTSATQSQQGELYKTTLEWQLSDEGGFNSFLYAS
jgi:hypothetical protein